MTRKIIIILCLIGFGVMATYQIQRWQCMAACMKKFQGPYPDIACKYECSNLWNKKPAKTGGLAADLSRPLNQTP